jgi:hypothetical protein
MEKQPGLYSPEYEAQYDTLMAMHAGQRDFLAMTGMLERAEAMLPDRRDDAIYHVSLNRTSRGLGRGDQMQQVNIRFGERRIDHNGTEHITSRQVAIAAIWRGMVCSYEAFDQDEAMQAVGLLNGLESLREQGVLPHLDESLNYIRDPAMKSRPSIY